MTSARDGSGGFVTVGGQLVIWALLKSSYASLARLTSSSTTAGPLEVIAVLRRLRSRRASLNGKSPGATSSAVEHFGLISVAVICLVTSITCAFRTAALVSPTPVTIGLVRLAVSVVASYWAGSLRFARLACKQVFQV